MCPTVRDVILLTCPPPPPARRYRGAVRAMLRQSTSAGELCELSESSPPRSVSSMASHGPGPGGREAGGAALDLRARGIKPNASTGAPRAAGNLLRGTAALGTCLAQWQRGAQVFCGVVPDCP